MWISKRNLDYLEKEIDFWRNKYDEERRRADALFDQMIQGIGLAPVGREAKEQESLVAAGLLKHAEQFKELLVLETGTEEGKGNGESRIE